MVTGMLGQVPALGAAECHIVAAPLLRRELCTNAKTTSLRRKGD